MLKIGDFSKLAQVSVKALRHYGKLGLIKPTWIDRFTGYRYYSLEQLPRLNRILALKDLGFSLDQIRSLLREDLPAAELRGMMRLKYAELEQLVQAEHARLERVSARLRQIEQEGKQPECEVVLKSVPSQWVVGLRSRLPTYAAVGGLLDELEAGLQAQSLSPDTTCPYMALYYEAEYSEQEIEVEVAAPLARPLSSPPRMQVHELPGVETMACAFHPAERDSLPQTYQALATWIEANGYRVAGPNRDLYLQKVRAGDDASLTEVQFPIEKKPIPIFVTSYKEKSTMEPKIVSKPAFQIVGLKYYGKNENHEISHMWSEFNPRIGEIQHVSGPAYGVCQDYDADGKFEYVAGMEVSQAEALPKGMVHWTVPEQKYAAFPCTLQTIGQAYKYAFDTWLPQSGYQRAEGPDFELYDDEFDPNVEGSVMYIYIPIT